MEMRNKINGVYGIVIFGITPLVVMTQFEDSYSWGKILFALIATMAVFIANGVLDYYEKEQITYKRDKSIVIILGILLVLSCLSTIFSLDFRTSLYGIRFGAEGLISIVLCLCVFYIFYRYVTFNKRLLDPIMILSCSVALIAILEYFGMIEALTISLNLDVPYSPNFTTIGNRNFVGTYAVLMLPIAMGMAIYSEHIRGYIYTSILTILLVISQTRSAYVALVFIIIYMIVTAYQNRGNEIRTIILVLYMVVFIGGGLYFLAKVMDDGRIARKLITLIHDILNFKSDSAGSDRMLIWKNTMTFIVNHPILGGGPDSFGLLYEKYVGPIEYKYRKAHNEWLQILVTMGIPYLMTYLALVFMAVKRMLTSIRKVTWVRVVLCCVIAYEIQAMFNISVAGNSFIFFAFLGLGASRRY